MQEIQPPTQCPDCASSIEAFTEKKSNVTTHWCPNVYCPGRVADMLTFVAGRDLLEIDGLGPELAAKLAKSGYVHSLADFFGFLVDTENAIAVQGREYVGTSLLKAGFPVSAVLKMVDSLPRVRIAPWDRWIAALGIDMIGVRLGKVLAEKLELKPGDFHRLCSRFFRLSDMEIEGIGFHKKESILRFATGPASETICQALYKYGVRPKSIAIAKVEGTPLAGMSFVITGEFPELGTRDYITSKLVSLGAVSKSGVTSKVTHLLVGTEPGLSKLSKAKALNLPQLDSGWLQKTFAEHGIQVVGGDFFLEEAV